MMVLTRPVQSKPLQQYATAVRYISTLQQYTTAVHYSSTLQQYTTATAVHYSSTLQQYTTAVHRWVRILARIREVRIATIMLSFQFDLQESIYW